MYPSPGSPMFSPARAQCASPFILRPRRKVANTTTTTEDDDARSDTSSLRTLNCEDIYPTPPDSSVALKRMPPKIRLTLITDFSTPSSRCDASFDGPQTENGDGALTADYLSSGSCYDDDDEEKKRLVDPFQEEEASEHYGDDEDENESDADDKRVLTWSPSPDEVELEFEGEESGSSGFRGSWSSTTRSNLSSRSLEFRCHGMKGWAYPTPDRLDSGFVGITNNDKNNNHLNVPVSAVERTTSCPHSPSSMIKPVKTSHERTLFEYLNCAELRRDPWNPAVPLLGVVNPNPEDPVEPKSEEEDLEAVLILEKLVKVSSSPFRTVKDALEFVKQVFQSLVFLHERGVAHLDIHPDIFMMHTGDAPTDKALDRSKYDVRYYIVDFAHALIVPESEYSEAFAIDIHDCGRTLERMFPNSLPEIAPLLKKMAGPGEDLELDPLSQEPTEPLTAADVLREFEGLIKEIPAKRLFGLLNPGLSPSRLIAA